jgi:alkanesulfonate monooxygenase SsuD/methylene tetrahydromethanopterin reductase-like flavin-dependent oxidoreductase (luciferase family)
MGIWLGVYGPGALRLTGQLADGWVPSLRGEITPLADGAAWRDQAVSDAGRNPAELRRVLNVSGEITDGLEVDCCAVPWTSGSTS